MLHHPKNQTPAADKAAGVFVSRVAASAGAQRLFADASRILVGFSGGADSTALLLLLREIVPCPLTAVHLHHGLRGRDADRDAQWCADFCRERAIPFETHRLAVPAHRRHGESLESAARRCRLEFWAAHTPPGAAVALGHHLDDALEDLFLRLGRGANASGLTGLRPHRCVQGVRFIRPLLAERRAALERYLRACGVRTWCEDRTNRDTKLRRNAIRHRLLPAFRRVFGHDAGLVQTLTALHDDANCLESLAESATVKLSLMRNARADVLAQLPPALLPRVLRLWTAEELGHDVIFPATALARIRQTLAQPLRSQREITVGAGVVLVLGPKRVEVCDSRRLRARTWDWRRQPTLELPEVRGRLRAEPLTGGPAAFRRGTGGAEGKELFVAAALPARLRVRAPQAGDRLIPFGHRHTKKLKELFVDAGVPHAARPAVPVLLAGKDVIWVPGVRRAEFGRVPADGKAHAVVRLTWESG